MTEYETKLFTNLNTLETLNKWYGIKQDRPDKEDFVNALKKRIHLCGDFEFSNCYQKFRRVLPFNSLLVDWSNNQSKY